MTSNSLRMPLQEWMWRMRSDGVPIQACGLAVFATIFKVTTNEDLARLANMDTRGIADKTYNKWKTFLKDNGWVTLKSVLRGRLTLIEIGPAYKHTPVIFTNVDIRDWKKYQDAIAAEAAKTTSENYGPQEQSTSENYGSSVETTSGDRKKYEPTVENTTPGKKVSPAPPSKKLNPINNLGCENTTSRRAEENKPHMNGVGFVISAQHDLIIPMETIAKWRDRFPEIDLEAKMEGLAAHILAKGPFGCPAGWQQPAAWMVSLLADENRKAKGGSKTSKSSGNRMSLDELSSAVDAAYEHKKPRQPQGNLRLTDER